MITRELFGGAMQICMPRRLQDMSDSRPVPDHQELYTDRGSDDALLIEIVVSIISQGCSTLDLLLPECDPHGPGWRCAGQALGLSVIFTRV